MANDLRGAAGLAAVWLACASIAVAGAPESVPPVVRALQWRGVTALPERELESHVFTRAPSWKPWQPKPEFREDVLERDTRRVAALYRRYGYYETRVATELEWDRAHRRVKLTFVVEEGDPVRLETLAIEIGPPFADAAARREELVAGLPLQPGDVFALRRYGAAKQELLTRLSEAGFPRARIAGGAEVDAPARRARVHWTVDPGPPIRFGEIRIGGLDAVDEGLVRRELLLAPGDPFSLAALRDTRERIYGLGLFRSVIVQPRPDESGAEATDIDAWPVEVRVSERPPRSLRVGLGWGTEDRLRGQLSWIHRNFLGGARRVELGLRYSSLLSSFDARFEQPRFLDPELRFATAFSLREEREPAYEADRLLARAEGRRPLWGPWTVRLAHQFEWNHVQDAPDESEVVLDDPEDVFFLSFFEFGLRRSTLSDSLEPRQGSWLDFSVEPALPAIGSSVGYLKLFVEGRVFRPLGRGVLAGRLRIGSIDPFGTTSPDEVPVVKRFYSGGSTSVRGFEFQRLGPLDVNDDPLGGTSLLEGSVEWRVPIWRQLGGVVFVDAGQVDLQPYTWRLDDVFYSAGVGLRYATPIGPLRLDFGQLLNPPDGVGDSRIHFSVGHAF